MKTIIIFLLSFYSIAVSSADLDTIKAKFIAKRSILHIRENKYPAPPAQFAFPSPPVNINHIFTLSGDSLLITANVNNITHKASNENLGTSIYSLSISGQNDSRSIFNYTNDTFQFAAVNKVLGQNLNMSGSRLYQVYNPLIAGSYRKKIDQAHVACDSLNIPESNFVLCLEKIKPEYSLGDRELPDSIYTNAINYIKQKGYQFRKIEIANEPFYCWGVYSTDSTYARYVRQKYTLIKSIDTTFLVGISPMRKSFSATSVLRKAANHYDWVSPHWYAWVYWQNMSYPAGILSENYRTISYSAKLNDSINVINARTPYQFDTEYRIYCWADSTTGESDLRITNIVGASHMAVRMIYNTRDGYERGSNSWNYNSTSANALIPSGYVNTYGTYLLGDGKQNATYWMKYYFQRHSYANVVNFTGYSPSVTDTVNRHVDEGTGALRVGVTGPRTPTIITTNSTKTKMGIIIVNGTSTSTPFSISLSNFIPSTIVGKQITDELDAWRIIPNEATVVSTLIVNYSAGKLTGNLAPYSINYIDLTK